MIVTTAAQVIGNLTKVSVDVMHAVLQTRPVDYSVREMAYAGTTQRVGEGDSVILGLRLNSSRGRERSEGYLEVSSDAVRLKSCWMSQASTSQPYFPFVHGKIQVVIQSRREQFSPQGCLTSQDLYVLAGLLTIQYNIDNAEKTEI